ncbi:MAG: DUF4397 domain-containing protein [Haloferacaceae archaeon]
MPSRRSVLASIGTTAVAAVGVGAVSAQSGTDDGEPRAAVRLAHASPDAPAVDVSVDGEEVVSGLEFRRVSDYLTLDPGDHGVRVTTGPWSSTRR